MRTIVLIPARWDSTRLPGKMLLNDTGKALVHHAYSVATLKFPTFVATDSQEIREYCRENGIGSFLTKKYHKSGTDRIIELINEIFTKENIIVNLQGDHPEVTLEAIEAVVDLIKQSSVGCTTLAVPITKDEAENPNKVKVVFNHNYRALYFSRQPIPCGNVYYKHIGIYAYTRKALKNFESYGYSNIEMGEDLEQLRFIDNDQQIAVSIVDNDIPSVDTPLDYQKFVERQNAKQKNDF